MSEDKPKRLMFQLTVAELHEFWRRAIEQKADTEEERMLILVDMANEGYKISISETSRTDEQIITDLQRHYKDILVLQSDDSVEKNDDRMI